MRVRVYIIKKLEFFKFFSISLSSEIRLWEAVQLRQEK